MQTHLHEFEREVYSLPLLVHGFDLALDLIAWLHDVFRHSYMVPAHVTDVEKPLHYQNTPRDAKVKCNSQTYGQLARYRHNTMTVQLYSRNHTLCWTELLVQKAAARLCKHIPLIHIISIPGKPHKRWITSEHQQQRTYMSASELRSLGVLDADKCTIWHQVSNNCIYNVSCLQLVHCILHYCCSLRQNHGSAVHIYLPAHDRCIMLAAGYACSWLCLQLLCADLSATGAKC